eukprot:5394776-Lingulodinium_polyedra.AAC.1
MPERNLQRVELRQGHRLHGARKDRRGLGAAHTRLVHLHDSEAAALQPAPSALKAAAVGVDVAREERAGIAGGPREALRCRWQRDAGQRVAEQE